MYLNPPCDERESSGDGDWQSRTLSFRSDLECGLHRCYMIMYLAFFYCPWLGQESTEFPVCNAKMNNYHLLNATNALQVSVGTSRQLIHVKRGLSMSEMSRLSNPLPTAPLTSNGRPASSRMSSTKRYVLGFRLLQLMLENGDRGMQL